MTMVVQKLIKTIAKILNNNSLEKKIENCLFNIQNFQQQQQQYVNRVRDKFGRGWK